MALPTLRLVGGHLDVSTPQKWLTRFGAAHSAVFSGCARSNGNPKLATQTVSFPSIATPHGMVRPPPVNGEPTCGLRPGWRRNNAIEGSAAGPRSGLSGGHGTSMKSEFATQMFPRLSDATPIGRLS